MQLSHLYTWLLLHCFQTVNNLQCKAIPPVLKMAVNLILKRWRNRVDEYKKSLKERSLKPEKKKKILFYFSLQLYSTFLKLRFCWWLSYQIFFPRSFNFHLFLRIHSWKKCNSLCMFALCHDSRATPVYLRSKSALLHSSHLCALL